MSERPKLHVFLGAPPPSCTQAPGPGAGPEAEERPPAAWRRLALTWQDGHLRPAAGGAAGLTSGGDDVCPASVHDYLDACFPAAGPEQGGAGPPLSTSALYLASWTLSQALVLRGRHGVQSAGGAEEAPPTAGSTPPSASSSTPELFSPAPPSPGASVELLSPRVEEGGVVMEATSDGVLCSQDASSSTAPPSEAPPAKMARFPEECGAPSRRPGATTPLALCERRPLRYSVLVAVVHPCHLKEIKVKSGPSAGSPAPLASIVVTDQSGVEMKVVLWRRAAFWALIVSPGDVLLITGLQVSEDRWRGETVLQSTFSSTLLNLGPASTCTTAPGRTPPPAVQPPATRGLSSQSAASSLSPVLQKVEARSLSALCSFLREKRPLLVSLKPRPPQDLSRLPYATLRSLRVNTLVHALLRVTDKHVSPGWRSGADSRWRSAVQLKATVLVEQPDGQQGALLLWGAALDWLPRLSRDHVWDFRFLLVREGRPSAVPELHSTPWSSFQALDPADPRALNFLRPRAAQTGSSGLELDLDTLLSQKYSGEVELRVEVTAFQFQDSLPSQNPAHPVLDSSTSLDGILAALGGDVTFTGCSRCSAELETDANGIYCPCYACLPHTAVRRFYRRGELTVRGWGNAQVSIQVPPVPLQKILKAPPDKLHRTSAPGSEVRQVQVAAERIQSLLSLPRKVFVITVRSSFLCDENSATISQDFTLLDLHFPS
ncbi:uncharacterized protein V6R79_010731 [Siganus canaliculatus]